MRGVSRIVVFGIVGLVGLLVIVGAATLWLFDPSAHKARLEAAASQASGLEVRIAGNVTMRLQPGLHVVLEDVHMRSRGADVVQAQQASVGIGLSALLGGDLQIHRIVLKRAVLAIERDRDGRFNFQAERADGAAVPARAVPDVLLSDATIAYADPRFGKGFEAGGCQVAVRGLQHAGGQHADLLSGLSFDADLACATARKNDITLSDLKVAAVAKNGIVELKPLTARVFGAVGSGSVRADYTGAVPAYQIAYTLPQFPIAEFLKAFSLKGVTSGRMDLSATLTTQGKAVKDMQQAMQGKVSLRGKDLTFNGGDLDQQFARFESSQNFSLIDVGGVLLAGPLGLLVTKGYDFASISQGAQGRSEIRTLVSDWKIEHGVARAEDVAMATKENRVALKGGIDWANDRFDDVTIALIDTKGCVKVQQKLRGTLQQPVVEKPGLLQALTGPAVRLLKKGSDLLVGDACEVFYAGAVAAPK
jgi:AsmA family/AsmA-like C-terminal region